MQDNARFEAVELKLAYLEQASQELSDVLYRQQLAMDALAARVQRLTDRLQALEERPREYTAEDEKPPHY
jgi:SlyX protein